VVKPAVGEANSLQLGREVLFTQTHASEHADGAAGVAAVGKPGGKPRPRHPNHSHLLTTTTKKVSSNKNK